MTSTAAEALTVGIDIGTTAVKALAVTAAGEVVARARVAHTVHAPSAGSLEHDAARAWRRGPKRALDAVCASPGVSGADPGRIAGVCVAAMVPSLTAVDRRGIPRTPGLLYGDLRGRSTAADDAGGPREDGGAGGAATGGLPDTMPDACGFLRWTRRQVPDAFGYWPAQAVASFALAGVPAVDTAVTASLGDLHAMGKWNEELLAGLGVGPSEMPEVVLMGSAAGALPQGGPAPGAAIAGGSVDALCDQIVAGASEVGDVLVICGATLVVWVVTDHWVEVPGLWTVPHTVAGRVLVGGPSNAGALFVDWARALLGGSVRGGSVRGGSVRGGAPRARTAPGEAPRAGDPDRVPVWLPYLRGERAIFHDPAMRSRLVDLDIAHGREALTRAAHEASGFVVRAIVERAGVRARRIVASGGGTRSAPWMEALADATGLPVDLVAVPEGAALGAAWLARMAAGLEHGIDGAHSWARSAARVEPEPSWSEATAVRYGRFSEESRQEARRRP